MAKAGIRDLRNHRSRYLERVQTGEELTVTDRGHPIAGLIPVDEPRPFDRLVAGGLVTPVVTRDRHRPEARVAAGRVSELVIEQRR